jgi:peptidoglycan/LPS O-acetylase OafA/YrhL
VAGRSPELDMLRGWAVLLVLGVHIPAYPIWSSSGWVGVDLFFVLSGFLISNLLFTEYQRSGGIKLGRFFLRRAMKLYPSFYFMLALTLVYCVITGFPFTARQLIGELTLTQNYVGGIWGHTWSLAVEEHFYLFLPLALWLMMRFNRGVNNPFRAIPYLFLAIALFCLAARLVVVSHHREFDHHAHYEPSHLRFDALFAGVFVSYLQNFHYDFVHRITADPWRMPLSLVSIVALAPALMISSLDPFTYTWEFSLLYIAFGILVLLAVHHPAVSPSTIHPGRAEQGMVGRGIGRLGRYSYTVYLWHVPLAMLFGQLADRFVNVNAHLLHAVYLASCGIVGVGLSKLIEIPALRLRDRLLPY